MFWGLIMEPQRRYTQKVKKSFHISMAALDISTSSEEAAQVMCGFEGRNYLLCTLRKPDMLQCQLDLNFEEGDEISLAANGSCHVHLTGYLTDELSELMEEEEDDEVEEEIPKGGKMGKKRNKNQVIENGPPKKKTKVNSAEKEESSEGEDEEEDDDNSDLDVKALLGKSLEDDEDDADYTSDENEDEVEEEEEEESDAEESGEEEEEAGSSMSEGDSDEEVQVSNKKISKTNGVATNKEQDSPNKNLSKRQKKKLKQEQQQTELKSPKKEIQSPKKKTLQGGVIIEEIKEGNGLPAKAGKFINVYYEGRLKSNNKVFDATNKGAGFSFRLGGGEVIKGWDVGVAGMKVGGKRRITCPPAMAYGQKGSPPTIPANSTLVFEVELKKVK